MIPLSIRHLNAQCTSPARIDDILIACGSSAQIDQEKVIGQNARILNSSASALILQAGIAGVVALTHAALMILVALLLATLPTPMCDAAKFISMRESHDLSSQRAVEVITLAFKDTRASSSRLRSLVSPAATFRLGSGDVWGPTSVGVEGAKALAKRMSADQFYSFGWDYMDGNGNACRKHAITVDFVNNKAGTITRVDFEFENGLVISASAWGRTFKTGPILP